MLRAPLYGTCSLLLAAGLGKVIADRIASRGVSRQDLRTVATAFLGLLVVLAVLSSGWPAFSEYRSVAGLPPAPAGARNVVLIVWDTVRAYNISSYGSYRDTTPNLSRWAQKGVQYNHAVAPAPWTYPSHCCFMTGQWPYKLNAQWKFTLDGLPLIRHLPSIWPHGDIKPPGSWRTRSACTYETGLGRGFVHFEDYPLSPRALLTRTVPGMWILKQILTVGRLLRHEPGTFYEDRMGHASVAWRARDQQRFFRLAGPATKRSPVLRLS